MNNSQLPEGYKLTEVGMVPKGWEVIRLGEHARFRTGPFGSTFVYEMMQLVEFKLTEHKRYWISEFQLLEIKNPEDKQQTAIASILSDMDTEIAAIEQRRNKTRDLKQAMMQELLTGRIRLKIEA